MNKGNENQVFDYILGSNTNDKIKSFIKIFKKVLDIDLEEITNIYDLYFIEEVKNNIICVKNEMCNFIETQQISAKKYIKYFDRAFEFISKININLNDFMPKYSKNKYTNKIHNELTPDIFLFSNKLNAIKKSNLNTININFINMKLILEFLVITNKDILKNYMSVFHLNEKIILNNYANINTVLIISKFLNN